MTCCFFGHKDAPSSICGARRGYKELIVEDALCALLCLQRSLWLNNVHRILLVTTSYHMRRSLHLFRYLFPSHIRIIPCPADDTSTRRDNWMHSEKGINRAKGEVMNIVRCVHNGVIPDFEI